MAIRRQDAHLDVERVRLSSDAREAGEVLDELADLLGGNDSTLQEAVRDSLEAREQMCSTGVGLGVAFPHARVDSLPGLRLAFVRTSAPVEFGAMDGKPVDLFLALAGPLEGRRVYLSLLSALSYALRNADERKQLREATSEEVIVETVSAWVAAASTGEE